MLFPFTYKLRPIPTASDATKTSTSLFGSLNVLACNALVSIRSGVFRRTWGDAHDATLTDVLFYLEGGHHKPRHI